MLLGVRRVTMRMTEENEHDTQYTPVLYRCDCQMSRSLDSKQKINYFLSGI